MAQQNMPPVICGMNEYITSLSDCQEKRGKILQKKDVFLSLKLMRKVLYRSFRIFTASIDLQAQI